MDMDMDIFIYMIWHVNIICIVLHSICILYLPIFRIRTRVRRLINTTSHLLRQPLLGGPSHDLIRLLLVELYDLLHAGVVTVVYLGLLIYI
jgi:hypothetical protein